jgi:hypothetical protein
MADDGVSVDELWSHSKTIFAFSRQIRRDAGPTADLDAEGLEKAAKLMEQAAIEIVRLRSGRSNFDRGNWVL